MNDKRKAAPKRDGKEWQNSNSISRHKDSKNLFAFHQRRVFNLLSDGVPRTVGSRYKRYFIEPSEPHIAGKEVRDDQ